jgi:hypothetical protein
VITNKRFSDWLNYFKLDAGQVILAAQQLAKPNVTTVTTSTTTTSDLMPAPVPVPAQVSSTSKPVYNPNDITKQFLTDSSQTNPYGIPHPSNLRLEKKNERSILVSWDPPTAPLSLNQSVDFDNNLPVEVKEQVISVQSYNIYLNNDVYRVVSGNQARTIQLDNVDLNAVGIFFFFFNLMSLFLFDFVLKKNSQIE